LPVQNRNDLIGIEEIAKDINVVWVDHANEVINHVLTSQSPLASKRQR
jgi:hypothetical protein